MENAPATTTAATKQTDPPPARRGRKKGEPSSLRLNFPAIPSRGLWDQATTEERVRAQAMSFVIMDYWMNRMTKAQSTKALGITPIRFWQMTNQAVAGMTAGLLTQPRKRTKGEYSVTKDKEEITQLKARIRELELTIETQKKLMEILRSMPGVRESVEVRDDSPKAKRSVKKRIPPADQASGGSVSAHGPARSSADHGPGAEGY